MYKLQVACLIILIFIAVSYFSVKRVRTYGHKLFSSLLITSLVNIVFDFITVYTVHHLHTVNPEVNRLCHIVFFATFMMQIYLCFLYCASIVIGDGDVVERKHRFWSIPMWIGMFLMLILPISYMKTPNGNYSWGPALMGVYAVIVFYVVCTVMTLLLNWKRTNMKKRRMVMLAILIEIVVLAYQVGYPYALVTSLGMVLIDLAFFMTAESPDILLMERLREEKKRADDANEAKSQFLSNMSHEIRTPMNAIVGLTEVLLRKEWPEKEMQYLSHIRNSGNALLSLINDLLDFSKLESGNFVITEDNYELVPLLEDLKIIFNDRIGSKKVDLIYDIDEEIPQVLYGDGMRIRQVVINLVNNAIKYTNSGYIKLTVKVAKACINSVRLRISVEDSGQGIKEKDLARLFDAFTQVEIKKNRGQEGSGLGLAICKQLITSMGGELQVSSEYRKGSNFYFEIWQEHGKKEDVTATEEQDDSQKDYPTISFSAKVLLVDDNELNREVACALLEPFQLQIDEVENGLQALQIVKEKKYDLIFMDHYMPIMDGIEATKRIRQLEGEYYKNLPILALTADAIAGEKEKFIEAGMNDVISKPIQTDTLVDKLRMYLGADKQR